MCVCSCVCVCCVRVCVWRFDGPTLTSPLLPLLPRSLQPRSPQIRICCQPRQEKDQRGKSSPPRGNPASHGWNVEPSARKRSHYVRQSRGRARCSTPRKGHIRGGRVRRMRIGQGKARQGKARQGKSSERRPNGLSGQGKQKHRASYEYDW